MNRSDRNKPIEDRPDIAANLIAVLEADACLVDQGGFTLALGQAREKLASFRLAEPESFVLLLVEVAHLLPACTAISFELGRAATRVTLEGAELGGDELRTVFDALFLDLGKLEPGAARRGLARRQLASAVNAALGLPQPGRVELCSVLAGQRELRLRFDPVGEPTVVESPTSAKVSSLSLVIHEARSLVARLSPREPVHLGIRRSLLRRGCRWASIPVRVDGVRVDAGAVAWDLVDTINVLDPSGRRVACGGWSEARAGAASQLVFVANGVIVETSALSDSRPGFLAVVEAGDLDRDLSQAKLVRDAAYEQRTALVRATLEHNQSVAPLRYDGAGESIIRPYLKPVLLALAVSFSIPLVAVLSFSGDATMVPRLIATTWVAPMSVFFGIRPLVRALHWRHLDRGLPAIGTVVASKSLPGSKRPEYELTMQVDSGGRSWQTSIHAMFDSRDPMLEVGSRVYLRVNRDDPRHISLARKPIPTREIIFGAWAK